MFNERSWRCSCVVLWR